VFGVFPLYLFSLEVDKVVEEGFSMDWSAGKKIK